jgi:uncharacterized UBP type Zn finger protein
MKNNQSGQIQIAAKIQRAVEQGTLDVKGCEHISTIQDVIPSADGCESCLFAGDSWVNLRLCLVCGHVGCCDSSKNKHASQHFRETGHPLVVSYEIGEDWLWCYQDQVLIEP